MGKDCKAVAVLGSRDHRAWRVPEAGKRLDPAANRRVLERIRTASNHLPPSFVGMELVSYVRDRQGPPRLGWLDADYAWTVYISHDPCHDSGRYVDDRNTVVAFHWREGFFRILGRELSRKDCLRLARGLPLEGHPPPRSP